MNIKLTYDNDIPFCESKNKAIKKNTKYSSFQFVIILIQIAMKMNQLSNLNMS
jgi:hypothetical protein